MFTHHFFGEEKYPFPVLGAVCTSWTIDGSQNSCSVLVELLLSHRVGRHDEIQLGERAGLQTLETQGVVAANLIEQWFRSIIFDIRHSHNKGIPKKGSTRH